MSKGRTGFNKDLHDLLRKRSQPLTIKKLAGKIGCGRSSLVQILNGRRSGRDTWKLLFKFLTAEEYDCAKQHADAEAKRLERLAICKAIASLHEAKDQG